jgi:hypothetical protein
MKKLGLILMAVAIALSLGGCNTTAHGGGQVDLLMVNNEYYEPGTVTATFAFNTMCNDGRDSVMSTIVWNDQTNGVQFTARLPWMSIAEFTGGSATTCDEMVADLESGFGSFDGTAAGAAINEKGQEVGVVDMAVAKPGQIFPPLGVDVCGGTASTVVVQAAYTDESIYSAVGCLDKGNIVFQ